MGESPNTPVASSSGSAAHPPPASPTPPVADYQSPGAIQPSKQWSGRLVPFIPILLALLVAILARQFAGKGTDMAMPPQKDPTGALAPDFSLRDAHKEDGDEPVTLSLLVDKGPVVLIFYQGYSCPRCIGHLRQVADQMDDYKKAGVQVMAISADTPANTRDSITSFGDFPFPLLSDRDNKIARAYGLEAEGGGVYHGVVVVDKDRRIRFYRKTDHPYEDIESVLQEAIAAKKPM